MKRVFIFGLIFFTSLCAATYAAMPTFRIQQLSYGSLSVNAPKVLGIETSVLPQYLKIRFVGDIMLGRDVESKIRTYGPSYPLSQMPKNPSDAFLVGNFEASVPIDHVQTKDLSFSLSVDSSNVAALSAYGFTHLGLANNHSYDFGENNFLHTVDVLKAASMTPFGDPEHNASSSIPVIVVATSTRIALVPIFAVASVPSAEVIQALMEQAKQSSDIQIVFIHWGEEYHPVHDIQQQKLAHELIDDGADVIVGHHPHVVEDIEVYKNKLIFYSLGNFIFDQYFSDDVMNGLMLQMTSDASDLTFDLLPVSTIGSQTAPHLMALDERDKFLTELAQKSSAQLNKMIRAGELTVPLH